MKALINKERMESGEAVVRSEAGFASAGPKAEEYDNVPYERLLRFAKLIGLTEAAPRPMLRSLTKKTTDTI